MSSGSRSRRSDAGETLIEILATITILGIAGVAIVAGIGTAVRSSGTQRGSANADVVLSAAAESVKAQTYVDCATSYLATQNVVLPAGWTSPTTSVKYWNGTSFVTTCPAPDRNLQLVTVTATPSGSNAVAESVEVLKRASS